MNEVVGAVEAVSKHPESRPLNLLNCLYYSSAVNGEQVE